MARPRNRRGKDSGSTSNQEMQTQTTGGNTAMATLENFTVDISDDELDAALAGSRSRGVYDENILNFLESGRRGVQINLEDGVHEGKKQQSVKTGYETARTKIASGKVETSSELQEAAKNTKVIGKSNPDRVFLVRQDVQAA